MNFDFLKEIKSLSKLYEFCETAEALCPSMPNMSAVSARKALEYLVRLVYTTKVESTFMGQTLHDMMNDSRFKTLLNDPSLLTAMHYIRQMGNAAAHDGSLSDGESVTVLENLQFVVGELCILMKLADDYPAFVKPQKGKPAAAAPTAAGARAAQVQAAARQDEAKAKAALLATKAEPSSEVLAEFAARMRHVKFDIRLKPDREKNHRLFLYASLRESGWPVVNVANQSLPCSVGIQMLLDNGESIDYVLYGRDNRPLAIVEYTETAKNIVAGRRKVIAKAEALAQKLGYKPIAYYTTGYDIYVIDQLGYQPRRVFNFHSLEELELLKQRATGRLDITNPAINDNITNRDYQKEAIRAACKAFSSLRRHALLVMATGTGKTRVSISAVDILMKAGWVKNVLFLADRTSLVRQAHKNFNKLLPSVTTAMYTGSSDNRDPNARIVFSTYQSMIRLINDETREFGIGRFDLIVVDEAHRSLFNKYGSLFTYFDALMLGLTATPRTEENRSTYEVFELPNGQPDFAYELEAAIADGYLVGFSIVDKTTDKMRRGIVYNELSAEEKARFEDTFASYLDEDYDPNDDNARTIDFTGTVIDAKELGRKIINLGTIDVMLTDLMKNGLRVNAGDKIGKTIIFASSHTQAVHIVERFGKLYPRLGANFCKLIDSQVDGSLQLIDQFGERDSLPQIAVSVDMMDTGIDVPDVLNLVFFKDMKSKIKFLQMIGRGTRLCPDIFGPGLDKQGFLILDYFDNFRYFNTGSTWNTVGGGNVWSTSVSSTVGRSYMTKITSASQLIKANMLEIYRRLHAMDTLTDFEKAYMQELHDYLLSEVRSLSNDNIDVQNNIGIVNRFRAEEMWDFISDESVEILCRTIFPMIETEEELTRVKSFDNLILTIEAEYLKRVYEGKDPYKIRHGFQNAGATLTDYARELLKLKTIPEIVAKQQLLTALLDPKYLIDNFSLEFCENIRKQLRELIHYIPDKQHYYVVDIADRLISSDTESGGIIQKTYAEKAQEYLQKTDHVILAKIRNLDALTEEEKQELETVFKHTLGTESDYAGWAGGNVPLLPLIRQKIGISDDAVQTKFGAFLNSSRLNPQQLSYMNQIITYVKENGDVTFMVLMQVSPFCDFSVTDLFGTDVGLLKQLVDGLHKPML